MYFTLLIENQRTRINIRRSLHRKSLLYLESTDIVSVKIRSENKVVWSATLGYTPEL